MSKIKLNILGISDIIKNKDAYVLILVEEDATRRIPIIIGSAEAQAIAIGLEKDKINPPRPLTHDLFFEFAKQYDILVREVIIYKLEEGIFYARIRCLHDGTYTDIESRTSDAIALATRFNCPIYTTEEVIEKAGIILNPKNKQQTQQQEKDISECSLDELEKMLDEAIEKEDYEKASIIRDEINRR